VELPDSFFLYTLATVSITFVGFSALLIVIRQSIGGQPTRYDTYFTLSFIQVGFIITASAFVPPLLSLYGWPHDTIWRVSSGAVAILILWFVASVPGRRRAATGKPTPTFIRALLAVQATAALALLLCAGGMFGDRKAAVYATAMTAMLFSSGVAYLLALGVMLPEILHRSDGSGRE
jgi:hypothetical protein